ncbi:hypothetical protein BGZ99_001055 [Dissophora globulifera]|uniref:Swiss Army Knife RNA repair protein HAD domain-containing protein n=1 Tax=Dissophora globulifera TaxID=979702 RepID=A0A9P6UKX7_9FUNG|nr:hypothetical protein BGZ99_001055 [Dissophora globulifera]
MDGRNGPVYSDQILRMVKAKGLDFDLIATKPTTAILLESSNMSQKESSNKDQMESSSKNQKESSNKNQKESFNKNQKEVYRKIHTFSIKHEFLYNVLLEYPSIRHMRVWDDRIEQITKFRRAGADWIQRKMLDTFELTEVNLPPRYMDHEREKALVLAMVAAHNQQVGVESRGGPMMVSGVAPMPPDRPELKEFDIWEPYVTYIPQRRALIEMVRLVRYTGVKFSASIQSFLEGFARGGSRETNMIKTPSSLEGRDLTSWVVPDELHVTLCLGVAPEDYLAAIGGLGATVFVEIEAVGEADGNIWALKVKGVDTLVDSENQIIIAPNGMQYSTFDAFFSDCKRNGSTPIDIGTQPLGHLRLRKEGVPHITMAYDRVQGSRPVAASKITVWEPITSTKGARRIILVGTIGEKQLYGIKSQNLGHLAVVHRAEVSIAELVKKCASERSLKISGRQLGSAIKETQKEMERLSIENKAHNTETITTLVNNVCDKEFD